MPHINSLLKKPEEALWGILWKESATLFWLTWKKSAAASCGRARKIYLSKSMPEAAAEWFTKTVCAIVQSGCTKSFRRRYSRTNKPWASTEPLQLLNERDIVHKNLVQNPLDATFRP